MEPNHRKIASITLLVLSWLVLAGAPAAYGQLSVPQSSASSVAAATPVSVSSGTPSALQVQQNMINQQVAELQRQMTDAQRCIRTASMPQILTDPQGNVNRVPQTDIVNCTRELEQLERRLVGLQRKAAQLSKDATFQASQLQGLQRIQQIRQRTQRPSLRSSVSQ